MVANDGRLQAEKIRDHVVGKVEKFGLNFETDIINGSNDGCTTMEKYGRLIEKFIQLCLAHGFQLGVVKVIYIPMASKKKELKNAASNAFVDDDDDDANSDIDSEEEEDDNDDIGIITETPLKILKFQGKIY